MNIFILFSLINTIEVIRHDLNIIFASLINLHCEMKQFSFVMYNDNLRVPLHERYLQVTGIFLHDI